LSLLLVLPAPLMLVGMLLLLLLTSCAPSFAQRYSRRARA